MHFVISHVPEVDGLTREQTRHLIAVAYNKCESESRRLNVTLVVFIALFPNLMMVAIALCAPSLTLLVALLVIDLCGVVLGFVVFWLVLVNRVMRPAMRRERERMMKEGKTDVPADLGE